MFPCFTRCLNTTCGPPDSHAAPSNPSSVMFNTPLKECMAAALHERRPQIRSEKRRSQTAATASNQFFNRRLNPGIGSAPAPSLSRVKTGFAHSKLTVCFLDFRCANCISMRSVAIVQGFWHQGQIQQNRSIFRFRMASVRSETDGLNMRLAFREGQRQNSLFLKCL